MERYESLFAQLKERKEGAFVPFVTLGDPGIEQSLKIIDTLIEAGADALELGIPFSDPIAEGPVIQEANIRALKAGAKRLVIGHYSLRYKDENMLVEEARAIFPETSPATEGMTFTLEKQR